MTAYSPVRPDRERSYEVRKQPCFLPGWPDVRFVLDLQGDGHWYSGGKEAGFYRSFAEAETAGRIWNETGLIPAFQTPNRIAQRRNEQAAAINAAVGTITGPATKHDYQAAVRHALNAREMHSALAANGEGSTTAYAAWEDEAMTAEAHVRALLHELTGIPAEQTLGVLR